MSIGRVVVAQPGADEHLATVQQLVPDAHWTVLEPSGPGWRIPHEAVAQVSVIFADVPPDNVADCQQLQWIQLGSHGYAQLAGAKLPPETVVTNASGLQDLPIAHWCLMMLLALARDFPGMLAAQRDRRWDRDERFQTDVTGRRVGIVGYGNIGREVARLFRELGLDVWVMARSGVRDRGLRYDPLDRPADSWGEPDRVFSFDQAEEFYAGVDVLVVAVPVSSQTAGMIDARALSLLPDGAILLNPARAGVIDETALLAALRSGRLAGAALDDHYRQPMPVDDPFWGAPGTLVTAHISGSMGSTYAVPRLWDLFGRNLRRKVSGQPLINIIARSDLELASQDRS